MRLSNEGFFLLDALLSVFILSCLCILCFTIYGLMERYEEEIFGSLNECEGCSVDEYD